MLGEEHPQTLFSMYVVAMMFQHRGDLEQAESLFREGLEISLGVWGEEDSSTFRLRTGLALNQFMRGAYAEAESAYKEILALGSRKFGESSPFVRHSVDNLVQICHRQGRYEEAESYRRQALEYSRRSQGEDSDGATALMAGLAETLFRKGDHAEAEALFLEALETAQNREYPAAAALSNFGLARLFLTQGDAERADIHFNHALVFHEENESAFGASEVATSYALLGDHDMALRELRRAVELGHPRAWIATEVDFAALHGNPEFEAILAEPTK